jgi:hypothetical protein
VYYFHLSVPNLENFPPVVDMSQNEVQVSELARPSQEVDAAAAKTCTGRSLAPTVDNIGGLRTSGLMSSVHQSRGNPRATNLIFFPELTLASGADDGNASVTTCQVAGEDGVVTERPQIDGLTANCLVNQFGARRGYQDQGPVGIISFCELGRAIFHFEDNRCFTLGFAGEKRIGKPLRDSQGGFSGWSGKAAPPRHGGRDRCCGGTNDIYGYDRPSRPIPAHALG